MSDEAQRILRTYARSLEVLHDQTQDLPEQQARQQMEGGSSLHWIVGHCLAYRGRALRLLGADTSNLDVDDLWRRYGYGSQPDRSGPETVGDLLLALNATQEELGVVLPEADLSKVINPENSDTVGDRMDFFSWHEGYHAGQLVVFRRWLVTTNKEA